MFEFQEKRKMRRFLYSRVTLVLLVLLTVFLAKSVWSIYKKEDMARDNLDKTAAIFNSLQAREKTLSSEIVRLKTESGIEEEVREKYGLVKPGEEVIVIVNKDGETYSSDTLSKVSLWQKLKNWLR